MLLRYVCPVVLVFAVILLAGEAIALPAQAVYCRDRNDQRICILEIKRSAKNFWEYRAVVSIDGQVQPLGIYDCRDRLYIDGDGFAEPFDRHPAGPVICNLFKRKRYSSVPPRL